MSKIEIKTGDGSLPPRRIPACRRRPKRGWVHSDFPVYDAAASERHWQTMLALFDAKLKH